MPRRRADIWFADGDVWRKLARPDPGPARWAPRGGRYTAASAIGVAEFEQQVADGVAALDAALAPLAGGAAHPELDIAASLAVPLVLKGRPSAAARGQQQQRERLDVDGAAATAPALPPELRRERPARGGGREAGLESAVIEHLVQQHGGGRGGGGGVSAAEDAAADADAWWREQRARASAALQSMREAETARGARLAFVAAKDYELAARAEGDGDDDGVEAAATTAGGRLGENEALVSVVVCEPGERPDPRIVLAELRLPASFTLAQLRAAIACPLDALARSAGAATREASFSIEGCTYVLGGGGVAGAGGLHPSGGAAAAAAAEEAEPPKAAAPTATIPGDAVRLRDLALRVSNRPTYSYRHQCCCEHHWFVSDLRAAAPAAAPTRAAAIPGVPLATLSGGGGRGDAATLSAYPLVLQAPAVLRRWCCGVCRQPGAGLVLCGHAATPDDPCLVCGACAALLVGKAAAEAGEGEGGGGDSGGGAWRLYRVT